MSQQNNNEKPLVQEEVLTATIVAAASQNALQIFDKKEEKAATTSVTTTTTTTTTTVVEQHSTSEEQQKVSSVASAEVDKTAVFEKQNKKMIVLGSINDEPKKTVAPKQAKTRTVSPREGRKPSPRAQRNNVETPMTEQTEDTAPVKVKEPSESLLKATAARVRDVQVLEERKKEKEPGYVSPDRRKSVENSWTPSERLLRPTQARIMDVKEWENYQGRKEFADDIWWEKRKPAETAKPKPNTPSKLFEPTASSSKHSRPKYDPATAQAAEVESPAKEVHLPAKIDQNSPLLKKTTAAKVNSWKQTEIVPEPIKVVCQYTTPTGPQHVQSKLSYDTKATALNRWKSKEQLEREQEKAAHQPSPNTASTKKVKGVSPRLMELNESLKHSVKPKYEKTNVDPREQGWQTVRRTSIPTIEEMHDSLLRSNGSVISSHRGDSSGSAFTSMEHEEEGHREDTHLAPEHEEPESESHEIQPEDDPIHHEEHDHHTQTVTVETVTASLTQSIQTLEVN